MTLKMKAQALRNLADQQDEIMLSIVDSLKEFVDVMDQYVKEYNRLVSKILEETKDE